MKIFRWGVLLALICLSGCCAHPGVFDRVHRSLETVQGFYGPLLQESWEQNDTLRRVVVAADTTLLLAGELQRQWCPDPGQTTQLELQAQEVRKQAEQAGVVTASTSPETETPNGAR
jgi:hypothetical protein